MTRMPAVDRRAFAVWNLRPRRGAFPTGTLAPTTASMELEVDLDVPFARPRHGLLVIIIFIDRND
jgi:hypothetical protein